MNAKILGISYYLPDKIVSNEDLSCKFPEWTVEKITDKIGIEYRHVAADDETAVDMAVSAANIFFEQYDFDKSSVDFLILCTQSPDYFLPTSACVVHEKLGLSHKTATIDINQGCSGFVYGLSLAKGLVNSNICRNVLLITSDTYSKYIHGSDKGNQAIFGDAASVTLVSNEGEFEIGEFVFGTDGGGMNELIVKNGAARNKMNLNDETSNLQDSGNYLYMNGGNVFNFTLKAVPSLIDEVIEKNNLTKSEIDYFVLHQANSFMLNTIRRFCKIEDLKFHNDMKMTGNTVSSTIPLVLKDKYFGIEDSGHQTVLLAGFGVGFSWAGCVLSRVQNH